VKPATGSLETPRSTRRHPFPPTRLQTTSSR
jgi:hypothetical protein